MKSTTLNPIILALALALTVASCAMPGGGPGGEDNSLPRLQGEPPAGSTPSPAGRIRATRTQLQPSSPAVPLNGEYSAEYEEVHRLYVNQQYDAAISKARTYELRPPSTATLSPIENLHGLSLLMERRPVEAIRFFRQAIDHNTRNPAANAFLRYNLAKAQFEAGQLDAAATTLKQTALASLDPANEIKYHSLRANIMARRKFHFEACQELLVAGRLLKSAGVSDDTRKSLEAYLDVSLKELTGTAQFEDLFRNAQDSAFAPQVLFRLGQREMALGDSSKAEDHFHQLLTLDPHSQYADQVENALRSTRDQGVVDHQAIGVLLPMNGKFAQFGTHNLQAIELAFNIFNRQVDDPGYTLVIEDSGEEPETAVKALNRLVQKHHVAAVIGPLVSKGVDQVSRRAEELGVPLISLARHTSDSPDNYVLQGGLTLQLQAYAIARYAIQALGMQKFAVVAPQDKIGQETTHYFWDAVESMGGQITGAETYTPSETDFREVVDKLSGLYYTDARQREVAELARYRQENRIQKKTRRTEQYFNLRPIVDYQAVFIADDPKVAAQIMPTFAYRDVDKVQFLGTSAWNSPDLIARAGNYAEGALFVDAFYPNSRSPNLRRFMESFRATFGDYPNAMDAMAYDAAGVLMRALKETGKSFSRDGLLSELKHTDSFRGVTGSISYKDGQLLRDLKVLSIQGGRLTEAAERRTPASVTGTEQDSSKSWNE